MQFLLLVCADSAFDPPATIGSDTEAWVELADRTAGRSAGDRLRSPSEAVTLGLVDGVVTATPGTRVPLDEQVVGFDLVECADLDAAVELVCSHPMARAGRVEIRPVWSD